MNLKKMKRKAKRVQERKPVIKRLSRADKIRQAYELKKRVQDALILAGLDINQRYMPYAKLFELLYVSIEPDVNERRVRLRRIISGVPKLEDAFWVEILYRYCSEIGKVSEHYCSFEFQSKFQ